MATNIELILEGLRGVAGAAGRYSERHQKAEAGRDKAAADEAARERLKALGISVEELSGKAAENPDYDTAALNADLKERGIISTALETGDPMAFQSLTYLRDQASENEKRRLENAKQGKEDKKATTQATKDAEESARKTRAEIDKLRTDYGNDDDVKEIKKLRSAYTKMANAADQEPSAGRDFTIVYNFMRMQDPNSVVREKEFQTAAEAKSWISQNLDEEGFTKNGVNFSWLEQMINKADPKKKGSFLLDSQVDDFTGQAETIFEGAVPNLQKVDATYRDRLKKTPGVSDSDTKYVMPISSDDDTAQIKANREKRAKKKEAKSKKDKMTVKPEGEKQKPEETATVVDEAGMKQIYDLNVEKVTKAIQAAEARQGVKFTPAQKQQMIEAKLKQLGIQTAPRK